MSKHTRGPWRAVTDPKDQPVSYFRGLVALVENNGANYKSVVAECGHVEQEEWDANTHLIAASPDLLAACCSLGTITEALLARLGHGPLCQGCAFCDATNAGYAAIAKAEGAKP